LLFEWRLRGLRASARSGISEDYEGETREYRSTIKDLELELGLSKQMFAEEESEVEGDSTSGERCARLAEVGMLWAERPFLNLVSVIIERFSSRCLLEYSLMAHLPVHHFRMLPSQLLMSL
jgi:hypothetical protein